MALLLGANVYDRVDLGSGSLLDNVGTGSLIFLILPTDVSVATHLYDKGLFANNNHQFYAIGGTTPNFEFGIKRATTNLRVKANLSSFTNWAANEWNWFACVWNFNTAATDQRIYHGRLATELAQPSSYTNQQVGSGTQGDNSAETAYIGNDANFNVAFRGRIARVIYYNIDLTQEQLIALQFSHNIYPNNIGFWELGWNGTGTQPDLSGNGNNGTVIGATVADHAPVPSPFPNRQQDSVYKVFTGNQFTKSIAGTSTNSGVIPEVTISLNSLIGTSNNFGAIHKLVSRILSGSSTNSGVVTPIKNPGTGNLFLKTIIGSATSSGILQTSLNPSAGGGIGSFIRGIGYWLRRRMR